MVVEETSNDTKGTARGKKTQKMYVVTRAKQRKDFKIGNGTIAAEQ
jgi:hypothetical protein